MFAAAREALPTPTNWHAAAHSTKDVVTIRIEGPEMRTEGIKSAYFFPAEWGAIDHAADQLFVADERGLTLTVAAGDLPVPSRLSGVLVLTETETMSVESRKGAVVCTALASLRFPSPLIKPDVRISRIRLSDWLHPGAHGGGPR